MNKHDLTQNLETLIALGEKMLTTFDIEELLRHVVKTVQELLSAEGATLYLVDPVEKLMISQVILSDRVEEIVLTIDNSSIAGFTALNRQSLNIPDAYGDLSKIHPTLKFNRAIDQAHNFRTRNILTFPIIIKDELIGVFQIINRKDGSFNDNDKLMLKNFAVLSGIAILNARLVERVVDEQEISRAIVEYISDEVYVQHRDGRLLHCNRKAQEKLPEGKPLKDFIGKPLFEVFPPLSGLQAEIQKVVDNNLDKAFSGGKMPYVILSGKNARRMVEKVIIILKVQAEDLETGIPIDSQKY